MANQRYQYNQEQLEVIFNAITTKMTEVRQILEIRLGETDFSL